jgi:hypothetical protein
MAQSPGEAHLQTQWPVSNVCSPSIRSQDENANVQKYFVKIFVVARSAAQNRKIKSTQRQENTSTPD